MRPTIKIFPSIDKLADALVEEFVTYTNNLMQQQEKVNICLSGGSTPIIFFKKLAVYDSDHRNQIQWQGIHFYWGDERCVPPDHAESNYGQAKKTLFDPIAISEENIHRIQGENIPADESERYADLLTSQLPESNQLPVSKISRKY